jgi:hypothetical protein
MDHSRRSFLQYSVTGYRATDGPGSRLYLTDLVYTIMDREDSYENPALSRVFIGAPGMARSALTGAVPVTVVVTG